MFKIKKQDYMKKKYINPNTEVISVKTQQMIAGSLTLNDTTGDTGVVLSHEDVGFDFSEEEFGF